MVEDQVNFILERRRSYNADNEELRIAIADRNVRPKTYPSRLQGIWVNG